MACSQRKVEGARRALSLYDGPAWRVLRRWYRDHPHAPLSLLVLSARYGLFVASERRVEMYNDRMTQERAAYWATDETSRRIAHAFTGTGNPDVLVCGGKRYADLMAELLPDDLIWHCTADGARGIGDHLHNLKEWLG